ncbi:hypothetical protein HRbin20_01166 [bacterium HR20]|nr:hypothetical protein HRbin20_01166 [bacterium HR20]
MPNISLERGERLGQGGKLTTDEHPCSSVRCQEAKVSIVEHVADARHYVVCRVARIERGYVEIFTCNPKPSEAKLDTLERTPRI